jgi:hypothetical protein
MGVQQAEPSVAAAAELALETELVQLALRAAEHHPILKAVYMGPPEWLESARRDPGQPEGLIVAARDLAARAAAANNSYVGGQARSIAVQLDVLQGRVLPYDQMVAQLLGVELQIPSTDEILALQSEVVDLAARLETSGVRDPVRRWEEHRLISGEAKWDIAMRTYLAGREYALSGEFPLAITEGLEIIRTDDELWSVNLSWYPPRRMTFEVNVATARTGEAVAFEVAHNIYPGDYLHLAVLNQHTYQRRRHVTASIKLKNAPESVISEGIEETALLRMTPDPSSELILATKLEWLRRMASLAGAIALHLEGRSEAEVLHTMANDGFMDDGRARFQLGHVKHPLWGPYQYTYILGRKLVEEADRRQRHGDQRAYLDYLYSGLHTPQTFLPGLDALTVI